MKRIIRIAFVSQPRDAIRASGSQHGSVAIVTWALARRIARRHEVLVCAPRAPGQVLEESAEHGIRIRRIPFAFRTLHKAVEIASDVLGRGLPYPASRMYFAEYAHAVARLLEREQPDVVHLQTTAAWLPALRRAVPRARLVLHVHDAALASLPLARTARLLAHADAVVTCSEFVARRLRASFGQGAPLIRAIGNGVDLEHFRPADRPPPGPFRFLYVGRVSPEKGVHVLVEAFDRLVKQEVDAVLEIVGPAGLLPYAQIRMMDADAPLATLARFYGRNALERMRRQVLEARTGYTNALRSELSEAAAPRVRFRGALAQSDLPDVYRASHALVFPSVMHEPFGLPLVEAMASGLPCIGTRAGAIPDVIGGEECGLLVDRADPAGLAQAMHELVRDPDRAAHMGRRARERAEAHFGWDRVTERLEGVYFELTAGTA
ncbi:MAG: glycosyltransferase family 4 protein [Pseudomonadota bacterium]